MNARSHNEILLWFELHPCEQCGNPMGERDFEMTGSDLGGGRAARVYTGECKQCGNHRRLQFELPQAWIQGLGDGPSAIIDADQFIAHGERLAARAPADPAALDPDAFFAANGALGRAITMIEEALKLRPSAAASLQPRLADLQSRRQRYAGLVAGMNARRKASGGPAAPAPTRFSREALDAHKRWLAAGRSGPGRLVLEGTGLGGMKLGSSKLGGARLVRVDLDGATLDFSNLAGAELVDCTAVGANFAHSVFDDAVLERCRFERAELGLCDLRDVRIDGGRFGKLSADRAVWNRAQVRGVDLRDALLGDSVLDGAVFEDCDLRGADLSRVTAALRELCSTLNATFRRCDLRGARIEGRRLDNTRFIDCKLAGITGVPVLEGTYLIENCDLSASAVQAMWGKP